MNSKSGIRVIKPKECIIETENDKLFTTYLHSCKIHHSRHFDEFVKWYINPLNGDVSDSQLNAGGQNDHAWKYI